MSPDVIIIGAGPAGLAAAATVAEAGAAVLLLDDQPAPGGQIYRAIESAGDETAKVLGPDYVAGAKLAKAMRAQSIDYVSDAAVWQVSDGREVGYSTGGKAKLVRAPWVILATGAQERPFPVPGWTLPGVMMAGAAQTLLKSSGMAAEGAVFAGSGPLLYLVAHQYLQAGVSIAALLDTTDSANRMAALAHLPGALSRWDQLIKGRRWMAEIKQSGTRIVSGVSALKVLGEDAATGIGYRVGSGGWREVSSTHIFLHQGVVPNVNLGMATGIKHDWDPRQLCWHPRTDDWGCTDIDGVAVAGDGAGIGGALAAEAAGRITALGVLAALGRIDAVERDRQARESKRTLMRERKIRPFLDAWFRPADHFRVPVDDNTVICRCEELTLKDIRDTLDIGIAGPNQLKSYCRAGMGPCQGRFCGLTVQELIASESGREAGDVGYYRLRPPIKPVPLQELADLETDPSINDA
ncbi:MAG: FAD-dependent oxidoreductase [Rhodospirillaceae bacterium]|nr:FAD-dependent oxidoreductase [Rhodospirillaceae bacterium]